MDVLSQLPPSPTDPQAMALGDQGQPDVSQQQPPVVDALTSVDPSPVKKTRKSDLLETDPKKLSKSAAVRKWLARITEDKRFFRDDFNRMIENVNFAAGYQRDGQDKITTGEYTVNLVLRNINQKVAALYARNPKAEFQRRKRMDFQLYNEDPATLVPVAEKLTLGVELMPNEMALMNDYVHGMQLREQVKKVGETLAILYQYQIDEHDPDFKSQCKSLVRRVATCGVGYVVLSFSRDIESILTSEGMSNEIVDRAKRLKNLLAEIEDEGVQDESDSRLETIKTLMQSLMISASGDDVEFNVSERLVFDFPLATSVIPDKNCRNLKGFIGARYLTLEYELPLEDVNAFFETDIDGSDLDPVVDVITDSDVDIHSTKDTTLFASNRLLNTAGDEDEFDERKKVRLFRVLDKTTKTHFFLIDGYEHYVQEPEPLTPSVRGFWPVFTLMFNDVEVIPGGKATIFPPSDVELMRHPQKEWNRSREALRKHRNANAAKYLTKKGMLTENDKDKLEFADDNAVIELEGAMPNEDVSKALTPMTHEPIDERVYDTSHQQMDILLAVGAQEANLGPPNPNGTATGQSIAEQSRNVGLGSNVDDLDDFLSYLAQAGGEMMLQEFSEETVQRIVGVGAAWPSDPEQQKDFLNEIFLKVVAASSGKPNKAMELQNWQMVAPTLQANGANPMFMVKETLKRADDRIDVNDAFPLVPQQPGAGQGGQGQSQGQPGQPQRPEQSGQPPNQQRRPGPGGNLNARQPQQQPLPQPNQPPGRV